MYSSGFIKFIVHIQKFYRTFREDQLGVFETKKINPLHREAEEISRTHRGQHLFIIFLQFYVQICLHVADPGKDINLIPAKSIRSTCLSKNLWIHIVDTLVNAEDSVSLVHGLISYKDTKP